MKLPIESPTKYVREGRGLCKKCARELDVVSTQVLGFWGWKREGDLVVSRHLNRIEEYGPKGALPGGFCMGSLHEGDPVKTPERKLGRKPGG